MGPNTLSPGNTYLNLLISFNAAKKIKRGNLSFAFQSMPPNGFMSMFTSPDISKTISGSLKNQIELFLEAFKKIGKSFAFWSSSLEVEDVKLMNELENLGIPVFLSSEKAMKSMAALYTFKLQKFAS